MIQEIGTARRSAALLTGILTLSACTSVPPVEPAKPEPVPTAVLSLRRSTTDALKSAQQLLVQTLVSESLQPGLLAKLSRPQADGIQQKIKDVGLRLQQCVTEGTAIKPPVEGHRESLERLITALSEFNEGLRVGASDPAPKTTHSAAFVKGAATYNLLRDTITRLALDSELPNPELASVVMHPSSQPGAGSARLNLTLGIPTAVINAEAEKEKERAALAAKAEAARLAELQPKPQRQLSHAEQVAEVGIKLKQEMLKATQINARALAAGKEIRRDGEPVYVRLDDNNLLMLQQVGGQLRIFKNNSGYAEYGAEAKVAGWGGSVDWSTTNVYGEISYLEALAYVDYDLERLVGAAAQQARQFRNVIDPNLVRATLSPLVCDRGVLDDAATKDSKPLVVTWGPVHRTTYPSPSIPVFLRLNDSTMLRATQYGSSIKFERNATGYGVAGYKIDAFVASGGGEVATMGGFVEISPREAMAYLEGDWSRLYRAALRQAITIGESSVWPNVLLSNVYPKEKEPEIARIQFKERPAIPSIGFTPGRSRAASADTDRWAELFKFSIPD